MPCNEFYACISKDKDLEAAKSQKNTNLNPRTEFLFEMLGGILLNFLSRFSGSTHRRDQSRSQGFAKGGLFLKFDSTVNELDQSFR